MPGSGVDREAGKGRQTASALVVLLVGDVLAPVGLGALAAGDGFGDGQVGHEVAGCDAVPVPFAGRGADDVAGVDFPGLAAAWLVEAVAFGDVEGLPGGVRVPCGAGRRGESGGADPDVGGLLAACDGLTCGPVRTRRSRARSVDALAYPTCGAICSTLCAVVRSRWTARSARRRCTSASGLMPSAA